MNADFKHLSRISILFQPGILVETFGNSFTGIDSSQWHFTILKANSSIENKFTKNGYRLYPNPATGSFILSSSEKIEHLEILTYTGQQIQFIQNRINEHEIEIRLADQVAGQYIMLINGTMPLKFIVD